MIMKSPIPLLGRHHVHGCWRAGLNPAAEDEDALGVGGGDQSSHGGFVIGGELMEVVTGASNEFHRRPPHLRGEDVIGPLESDEKVAFALGRQFGALEVGPECGERGGSSVGVDQRIFGLAADGAPPR